MNLILASFSKARAELLRAAGYEFTQSPSGVHERAFVPGEDPGAYVTTLARQKAEAVATQFPDAVVLGADTVLYMDGQTIGKPVDIEDAVRMLTLLAGRTHQLFTGICVIKPGQDAPRTAHDIVEVTMRDWSEAQIRKHVEVANPLHYAGAYALQQEGCVLIERMVGDPNTVIGLPMGMVETLLKP
jgi:septum formation protein